MSVRGRDLLPAIFSGCDGLMELRALPSTQRAFVAITDMAAVEAFAVTHRHENVFFGVATRRDASGGALSNCLDLGALFVDVDAGDERALDQAQARLARFFLPPSIVVESGGGLHLYWLLKEPATIATDAGVTPMLRRLAHALGGDLASAEPARILRVPGTLNHKYEPARRVTIQAFDPDLRYNVGDFDFLPTIDTATTTAPPMTLESPITPGARNLTLYRLARSLHAKQLPVTAIASAVAAVNATSVRPPLDDRELRQIVRQATTQADRHDFVGDVELEETTATAPVVVCMATVQPEDVEYIWDGRIARAKLNLLVGDPGLGKSFITLDVAARVSRGLGWPDGGHAPLGDVVILSAEDGLADTLRPRLDALGADVHRVHALTAIRTVDGTERAFSLVNDIPQLEAALAQTPSGTLAIIDPLGAYFGATIDSYKDTAVRAVLAPLASLAERTGVAILGVMHLTKGTQRPALHRALGSVGFVAAARLVLAVASHPDDDQRRILAPVKSNVCAPAPVLAYGITDGRLVWEAGVVEDIDIDTVLAGPGPDREERREADAWLTDQLADGAVAVRELQKAAREAGMAWRSIERAKARLRIRAAKTGYASTGLWSWELPACTIVEAKSATTSTNTATLEDVAVLSTTPAFIADLSASPLKTATFSTVADLPDPVADLDAAPAWVTDTDTPDLSDPIGAHDEEDDDVERF